MPIELLESDRPKSFNEKLVEFFARPPQPILRFYGDILTDKALDKHQVLFSVRNGLPLPLLYGIYAEVSYDSFTEYAERADHIGPFSTDDWQMTFNALGLCEVEIRLGLVPFEILTDKVKIVF